MNWEIVAQAYTRAGSQAHHSLPPSMMISPASMNCTRPSMVESTGAPAFTRIITRLRSRAPPARKWPRGLAGSLHTLQLHFILIMVILASRTWAFPVM